MATRKYRNIYFLNYLMAFRKFTNIFIISRNMFVLLLILMVGSRIHYSSFASYMPLLHKKGYGPTDRGIIT